MAKGDLLLCHSYPSAGNVISMIFLWCKFDRTGERINTYTCGWAEVGPLELTVMTIKITCFPSLQLLILGWMIKQNILIFCLIIHYFFWPVQWFKFRLVSINQTSHWINYKTTLLQKYSCLLVFFFKLSEKSQRFKVNLPSFYW